LEKAKRLFAFLMLSIVVIGTAPAKLSAASSTVEGVVSRSALDSRSGIRPTQVSNYDLRKSSKPRKHAYPTIEFWEKLAQCETAQDWGNGGRYAGGLGIMTSGSFPKSSMGTWERYGGEQFAPSPDKATKDQQIVVANRIAVEGYSQVVYRDPDWAKRQGVPAQYIWDQKPVGLTGWGCYKSKSTGKYRMAKPKMYYYSNHEDVVYFFFSSGEKSKAAHDLQMFLGIKVDGWYGPKTQAAHMEYLKKHPARTGDVRTASGGALVVAQSVKSENSQGFIKRCPKWEKLIKQYKLPVKEFSYIMWRESRCQRKAIGWNYKSGMGHWSCKLAPAAIYKKCKAVKSYDSGLLQINSSWVTVTSQVCKSKWGDMTVLLDAKCNIAVARYLYDNGGMHHWKATSGRYSG
jgi:hypothetical protein